MAYGILIISIVLLIMIAPAWWLAGRIQDEKAQPFFRLLCAIGLALVGYISFVNLLGRALGHSTTLGVAYVVLSAVATVVILFRWPSEMNFRPLALSWRDWAGIVFVAIALGFPQWILAVSSPYWDEVASSAIHLTAANQFAEGVFPPRHNALPDVPIKYHYGFTILSGTMTWLTGLSANVSIDVVSTGLWLFTFLFIVYWLCDLKLNRTAAIWGGCAVLLGDGLSWLYIKRVESYSGFEVSPGAAALVHRYVGDRNFFDNLLGSVSEPSAYLRNGDGTLSNLPWNIAAQFQQHAVALGMPLTLLALYFFTRWQTRSGAKWLLLVITIATFSVLMLAHAVFGGVTAVTAGIVLFIAWVREPTRWRFADGLMFGVGVAIVAFAHGGMLTTGAEYGLSADLLTLRGRFGYFTGGMSGFVHWNLAGFGIPLVLALVALGRWRQERAIQGRRRGGQVLSEPQCVFYVLTVFSAFSYFLPHLVFYSSESIGVEQFTEISKFFFTARLGFALLSAFGVAYLLRKLHWGIFVPACMAMAVTPIAFIYMHSTTAVSSLQAKTELTVQHQWLGLYRSPYYRNSIEEQMATRVRELKSNSRETYFDASADERTGGYLNEMLIFGGSLFTLTPSQYERTGVGYRLASDVVARRFILNGRMSRLLPGSAEACECLWYYTRPTQDMAFAPTIVRARFDKLVKERYFMLKLSGGGRALYSIVRPTADLDAGIHRYWRPRIISQAKTDWDGDGRSDLIFYDYAKQQVLVSPKVIVAPTWLRGEFVQLYVGQFPGDRRADLHFGRMKDTEFRFGRRIEDVVEHSSWAWSYRASTADSWDPEYQRWNWGGWGWGGDIPLVADLNHDGYDSHLMYRPRSGEWELAPAQKLMGPTLDKSQFPLPFAGRFLQNSVGDLAVWGQTTSAFVIQSVTNGHRIEFQWGSGATTDVLVPADYDGDGYDEIALWNRINQFWYWRRPPDGPMTQFRFGTPTAVPVPFDYNHDGRVDPAYWEPKEEKIYVTFSDGRTVDRVIPVPPNAIPVFVNMF